MSAETEPWVDVWEFTHTARQIFLAIIPEIVEKQDGTMQLTIADKIDISVVAARKFYERVKKELEGMQ